LGSLSGRQWPMIGFSIRPSKLETSHIHRLQACCSITTQSSIGPRRQGPAVSLQSTGQAVPSLLSTRPSQKCYDPPSFGRRARPPASHPCEQALASSVRPSSTVTSKLAKLMLFQTRHWRISSRDGTPCHLRSRPTCGWPFETE
jgi:hypothetical protein